MKKLIGLLFLLPAVAGAFDTSLNPDKAVSIGLSIDSEVLEGDYGPSEGDSSFYNVGSKESDKKTITIDLRVPLTNRLTIETRLAGVSWEQRFNSNDQDVLLSDVADLSGSRIGLGLRYYFLK